MDSMVLLGHAKKHLHEAYATKDGRKMFYSLIEAAILAAAAVECEVNWILFKPVLLILKIRARPLLLTKNSFCIASSLRTCSSSAWASRWQDRNPSVKLRMRARRNALNK